MGAPQTCWSLIRDAASGLSEARQEFAENYESALRAYLGARWRSSVRLGDLEDAVQDIFIECLKSGGALEKVDPDRGSGFRAFLYGVARRVALRYETSRARDQARAGRLATGAGDFLQADELKLSRVFDQAFARSTMQRAMKRQAELASERGVDAQERVELLRQRFQESKPIRDIASAWGRDPALVHRAYARARREFEEALLEVLMFDGAPTRAEAERRAADLLKILS